jgi:hypothetical protein
MIRVLLRFERERERTWKAVRIIATRSKDDPKTPVLELRLPLNSIGLCEIPHFREAEVMTSTKRFFLEVRCRVRVVQQQLGG